MNRAHHDRLVADDVKAAQQAEASLPEHLLLTTEPMIRYREIPRDVAEEQHWEDRAFDQWAQDVADEWDRIEARTGEYDPDERGAGYDGRSFGRDDNPGEYRDAPRWAS